MYSMFQVLTLDSWSSAIGRPLFEVKPWLFCVFAIFIFLTSFGLLNIVIGVIVENTINAAKNNDTLQRSRSERALCKELQQIRGFFEEADGNNDGCSRSGVSSRRR